MTLGTIRHDSLDGKCLYIYLSHHSMLLDVLLIFAKSYCFSMKGTKTVSIPHTLWYSRTCLSALCYCRIKAYRISEKELPF
jgi:hypothetical protein